MKPAVRPFAAEASAAPGEAGAAEGRSGVHPVDVHVGRAVRVQRKLRGLTQQALAERIGLTFQQVQKYETGANRISASALHAIAGALGVPVAAFFEGLPEAGRAEGAGDGMSLAARLAGEPGGLALASAWLELPPGPLRRRLGALVEAVAMTARGLGGGSAGTH